MPHIVELFPEKQGTRDFLRLHKVQIRLVIARVLGYPSEEVAIYPREISEEDMELADNLLELELIVEAGEKAIDREQECSDEIVPQILARCPDAELLHFGVWVRSPSGSGFTEHKPS